MLAPAMDRRPRDWEQIGVIIIGLVALILFVIMAVISLAPVDLPTPPSVIDQQSLPGRLAFIGTGDNGSIQVITANARALDRQALVPDVSSRYVGISWSATGSRLALGLDQDGNLDIYTLKADGTELRRLTTAAANDYSPAWSPNGMWLAFVSTRDDQPELYVMRSDGSEQRRLTSHPASDLQPAWAPDSTRLAFVSERDGALNVYLLDTRDGSIRQLTHEPTGVQFPAWSPDGETIAVSRMRDGQQDIATVTLQGILSPITTNNFDETNPAWSPDGQTLAFLRVIDGKSQIIFTRPDGSGEVVARGGSEAQCCLRWSP